MMAWMIMLLAAIVVVGWLVQRSRNWQTLLVGSGENSANELEAKYAHLKSNEVQCKLKVEAASSMGIAPGGATHSTVKLAVHKRDVDRANELLEEFDKRVLY